MLLGSAYYELDQKVQYWKSGFYMRSLLTVCVIQELISKCEADGREILAV